MTGTLYEDVFAFIVCMWIILRIHFFDKSLGGSHIQSFFFPKLVFLCVTMCKKHKLYCCIFTATVVTRMSHNVTFYVHCLSCFVQYDCSFPLLVTSVYR